MGKARRRLAMVGLKHAWSGWQAGVCPCKGVRRPGACMRHAGHGRGKDHARGRARQHRRMSTGCRCRAVHVGVKARPGAMASWGLSPGARAAGDEACRDVDVRGKQCEPCRWNNSW